MQVQSVGWKDTQGVGIGNLLQYSCWKVPRAAESGGLQSMGLKIDTAEHTHIVYRSFQVKNLLL